MRVGRALQYGGLPAWSRAIFAIVLTTIFTSAAAFAQGPAPIISKIEITGNHRIEDGPIRIHISQEADQPFDREAVDADIKAIYEMGFFSEVQTNIVQRGDAYVLVYEVIERPQVGDVKVYTTEAIRSDDEKIVTAVKVQRGSILDPVAVKETIKNITQVYADMGYPDAKVTFKTMPRPDNIVFATFSVSE